MQGTQLRYVIKFVADMDKAVKFYRDVLGLTLKFESPGHERQGRSVQHASHEAGFRRCAGAVRGFRGRTLQCGRGGGVGGGEC